MTDVRLTATNPLDSSVVPVACNEKGELKLEEPVVQSDLYLEKSGGNVSGTLTVGSGHVTLNPSGQSEFVGDVVLSSQLKVLYGDVLAGTHAGPNDLLNSSDPSKQGCAVGSSGYLMAARTGDTPFFVNYKYFENNPDQVVQPSSRWQQAGVDRIVFTPPGAAFFAGDVVVGSRNKKWMIVESGGLAHLVEQTEFFQAEKLSKATPSYPSLRDIPAELTFVQQQLQKVMERLKMTPEAGWEVWDGSD